jgi:hypothetical protein
MKKLVLALFLFATTVVDSQSLFNKIIDNGAPKQGVSIKKLSNGDIITLISNEVESQNYNQASYGTVMLIRQDSIGNDIFFRTYNSFIPSKSYNASDVTELSNGDLVITGTVIDNQNPLYIVPWAMRIDAAGVIIWDNELAHLTIPVISYSGRQAFELPNGNILIQGGSIDYTSTDNGHYFMELDANGTLVNDFLINGERPMQNTKGWIDASGEIFLPMNNFGFLKMTHNNLSACYGARFNTLTDTTAVKKLIQGNNGNTLLLTSVSDTGSSLTDVALFSYDTTGTFQWMHRYRLPKNEYAWSIVPSGNDYIIFASQDTSSNLTGKYKIITLKIDGSGNVLNAFKSDAEGYYLSAAEAGSNLFMTGLYRNINFSSSLHSNLAIVKSNTALTNLCSNSINVNDTLYQPSSLVAGTCVQASAFSGSHMQTIAGTAGLASFISYSVCSTTGVAAISDFNIQMILYPNPATESIGLLIDSGIEGKSIIYITDILGRVVHTSSVNIHNGYNTFTIDDFHKAGIYQVSLITNAGRISRKLIVE